MVDFLGELFDTVGFTPRWQCGSWSAAHGWTHIIADCAIFGAYAAIPCVLSYFAYRRRDIPFQPVFWLFAAFILSCGVGHLIEASIFWHPWYRFSGLVKVFTALVSWATVLAIIPMLPRALALPGLAMMNQRLQAEIDERKQAEDRFQLVVEAAPNAVVMINDQGHIVLVNSQTEKFFGYRRDELLGKSIELLVPDRFREKHPGYRQEFFRTPAARSMGVGRDLHGRRKDNSEFPVEIGLNPIQTKDGLMVLSAIVDITERKHAEEESRRRLAELAHVARLSTLGEMMSGLAHEINQPLAAAANYSRACVRFARAGQGATQEQLLDWMEKTAVQANRACEIVQRLGAFMQKDRKARAPLDVNQLVDEVVLLAADGLLSDTSGHVEVQRKLDQSLPHIVADRVQIEQVLVNLVRNGIEAMRDAAAEDQVLVVQTARDGEFIRISVTDRGRGISPEHVDQLFERFFTTKSEGMGLGLSISRSIVDAHSGRLWCEPNPDRGTTFSFTLPFRTESQ